MVPRAQTHSALVLVVLMVAGLASACLNSDAAYPGAKTVTLDRIQFEDGDTIILDGKPIRFLGVDTPETASPSVGIMTDQPGGQAASQYTKELLVGAQRIELALDGRDTYGRRLAHVFVDGELLAVKLLEKSLAYENVSHFGDNGFPDLADRIIDASLKYPRPTFEEPYRWRRKNQRKR